MGLRCATRTLPAPLSTTASPALSVYLRECGASGSASARTACPGRPTLRQSRSCHSYMSPLHPGAHLCPSYRSRRMFIFYLLGVGPPCCSIFCQFWLCEEAQCVYLRRHLGSPSFRFTQDVSFTYSTNPSCTPCTCRPSAGCLLWLDADIIQTFYVCLSPKKRT